MAEPKKFSFGFSKVAKKPTLFTPKPVETVEYIKCVEDKTVKLVHEEAVKPKTLPIIPMPAGSSVRDRILEAIKAREAKAGSGKSGSNLGESEDKIGEKQNGAESSPIVQNGAESKPEEQVEAKPLTLDEMAAKELLENARMETEEKKEEHVIKAEEGANRKQSTLDDYDNMPINDFGLAMLRGMGWDPKKGIGLNEKVVMPTAPQLRPKGMGLGADKALVAQKQPGKISAEEMVMKKGSMVKVIHGPHSQLYGKIEGFEELPGRIMVRLTLSNVVVSLNEFMVQLVGPTEYNKNSKVMNLDKYNAALDSELERKPVQREVKAEHKPRETYSKPVKRVERRSRSRSPVYEEKSSSRNKSKKNRDRSRNRGSPKRAKQRDSSESDSSDEKYRKRKSPDRRRHKSSKKSKYQSSSSSDDSDHRRSKKSNKSSKHSKQKSYKSDSDSSPEKYRKKHKKSRK
uniref:G-patch domain-containing protein n=1 Tax=Lygus hesperus TaxID=30085 RepID=A0A0K8T946_LYGHE